MRAFNQMEPSLDVRRGGPWRVVVDLRQVSEAPLTVLRVLLVADLLGRAVARLNDESALLAVLSGGSQLSRLEPSINALGIREPRVQAVSTDAAITALGGDPVVRVAAKPVTVVTPSCATIAVGAVNTSTRGEEAGDLFSHRHPLALRLALLRVAKTDTICLSSARLRRADETLYRWRYKVADWYDMPSAPPVCLDAVDSALANGLDTPTVLKVLHHVETDLHAASGGKFNTFLEADQVLGLGLQHRLRGRRS